MPKESKGRKLAQMRPAKRRRLTQAERTGISDSLMHVAAMRLIGKGGTHNLKLNEVSKLAGYSRSLASARFGTKDALFSDLISNASQRWLAGLADSIGDKSGIAALRAWSNGLASLLEKDAVALRALYILCYETIGSSEAARKLVAETHVTHRARLERWIGDGVKDGSISASVSPRGEALHYVSLFYGLIYQWLVEPDQIDIVSALRTLRFDSLEP